MTNELCLAPWNLLRIESDGNCYSCSSAYVKDAYSFGNIFQDEIDEIWNGTKAQKFRQDKENQNYNFCQKERCNLFLAKMPYYTSDYNALYPVYVSLSYDYSCSERCIFCRDKILYLDDEVAKKWESILHSKIIPLLKNAKILEITCAGEIFVSKHSQYILKEILAAYPNLKLKLFSNGLFCTEKKFKELGILNNIEEICISLHCTKKSTYKKIFRNDNYDKIKKNIEYIAFLKQKGIIKSFCLQFVITKYNYKEIKSFIDFAKKNNAFPVFNFVVENNETVFCKNYYNYAIYKQDHYLYNDFVSKLQDPFVREHIPDYLKQYKRINKIQIIKNYIKYLLYILKRKEG